MSFGKLTIVIPSFNRPRYLFRTMKYWSGKKIKLIVLDGSEVSIEAAELSKIDNNVDYYHLPKLSFNQRIEYVFSLLDTEYTMFGGDDEFYLESGLKRLIIEIESNPELLSVMGRSVSFYPHQGMVAGNTIYNEMDGYSLLNDDPAERMIAHMNPYVCSTIYSVMRTPIWIKCMTPFVRKEFEVYAIGELQFELVSSFLGKSKVLPVLTWLRSRENETQYGTSPSLDKTNRFEEWWVKKEKYNEVDEFIKAMLDTILAGNSNSTDYVKNALMQACSQYIRYVKSVNLLNNAPNYKSTIVININKMIPGVIKKLLKLIIPKSAYQYKHSSIFDAAGKLASAGVDCDFIQLTEINDAVIAFHSA